VGEWRFSWRIVLHRAWGFPGEPIQTVDADSVRELRAVLAHARADPSIERWKVWRAREWIGGDPPHDCGSNTPGWAPVSISERTCRCGLYHRTYRCYRCGTVVSDPPTGPGCAPLPEDHGRPSSSR
jgi:hypothetical protein